MQSGQSGNGLTQPPAGGSPDRSDSVAAPRVRVGALRVLEAVAWALFFLLAGAFLALRYWALPNIEQHRDAIVGAMTQALGLPVRVGRIEADWPGLRPRLSLADVRIYDREGREALALPGVEATLSWRSLAVRQLRLRRLVIDRPRLGVRRDPAGALFVAGLPMVGGDAPRGGLADWFIAQREIEIRNARVEWRDERRGAPPLVLGGLQFRLENRGDRHAAGFTVKPPPALGTSLHAQAEFVGGRVADFEAWNGRLFVELGDTDLAGWRSWVDYPVDISRGRGALRVWLSFAGGRVQRATADLRLGAVATRLGATLPLLELARVSGRVEGRLEGAGVEIGARDLALVMHGGREVRPTSFDLRWSPPVSGVAEQGDLSASLIELEPLAQLSEFLPFAPDLRARIAELAPQGSLSDVRFRWTGRLPDATTFDARAAFAELSMNAWRTVPGFRRLSGRVEATPARGSVWLNAGRSELDLPKIFPQPRMRFDALQAQVGWHLRGERAVEVRIASLDFANEHLAGSASGSYLWEGDGPGSIDLEARLRSGAGRYTARYLPSSSIMGQSTRAWLERAILGGEVSEARLKLQGDLRQFPFARTARGTFRVDARVRGATLDYAEGWPKIYDIDGELHFDRDRVQIVGHSGTLQGARLSNVKVEIPSLLAPRTDLLISGQAEGATAQFLAFVGASPVRRMIRGFTDGMRAEGRSRLGLKLTLPLDDLTNTRVAGELQFSGNRLVVSPQLPPIDQASGAVNFTEAGLQLNNARGTLFEGPARFEGGSTPQGGVRILARGHATVAGLRTVFDHPWRQQLSGGAAYLATIGVEGGRTRVSFESDLRGVQSVLPPPLDKAAGETLPLRVDVIPSEGGSQDRIALRLARVASADFLRAREGGRMSVTRTAVVLRPAADLEPRFPDRDGVAVTGSTPALDLDRWLAQIRGGAGGAPAGPARTTLDLEIGTLDAFGKRLNGVTLKAGTDAHGWSANLRALELEGNLAYRGEGRGLVVARLQRFRVPDDAPGTPATGGDGGTLPAVDLVAERFSVRGKQLGRVEVKAQQQGEHWRIERLAMINPDGAMTGNGVWHTGGTPRTSLTFDLQVSDSGKFLERIGYPGLVRGAKAALAGTLDWHGGVLAIDYPSLAGRMSLSADDGQFLEIEPGIGKLVSLMSMQMLPRRIALDFRDVFSQGFQFDRIRSSFDVEKGVLRTQDFRMRGPAAEVSMTGTADLRAETQDLKVRVVPSLGDSASTVVGLVNPVAGIATLIAQRVLKNPLGEIFAYDYGISGTWTNPKVEKLGVVPHERGIVSPDLPGR